VSGALLFWWWFGGAVTGSGITFGLIWLADRIARRTVRP
jgi:uncharacterized RDD family membrane protein YckC